MMILYVPISFIQKHLHMKKNESKQKFNDLYSISNIFSYEKQIRAINYDKINIDTIFRMQHFDYIFQHSKKDQLHHFSS